MEKIKVNENCIGCGACTAIAPEYFEFNDDGYPSLTVLYNRYPFSLEKI